MKHTYYYYKYSRQIRFSTCIQSKQGAVLGQLFPRKLFIMKACINFIASRCTLNDKKFMHFKKKKKL